RGTVALAARRAGRDLRPQARRPRRRDRAARAGRGPCATLAAPPGPHGGAHRRGRTRSRRPGPEDRAVLRRRAFFHQASLMHSFTCNLCEAMCGMHVEVADGRIGAIRGNPDDVFSRGHICPKGPALRELYEDPDRLRTPMRRTANGSFSPVSWEEAFDEASERLRAV